MISGLHIQNFGVIVDSEVPFGPGLTCLTGETGAGKTMVLTGLRLLAGGRADASRVRTGASEALVEGTVAQVPAVSREVAANAGGVADENDEYIIARQVQAAGRSKAHLGGRMVPAATLTEFMEPLLAIHGQNDQLRLLGVEQQRAALDRSSVALGELLADYQQKYRTWQQLKSTYKKRVKQRRELAQEADMLAGAIAEIEEVNPQPGELEELEQRITRLQDADSLREAATMALVALDGGDAAGVYEEDLTSVGDLLKEARSRLQAAGDEQLQELGAQLRAAMKRVKDVSLELSVYLANLEADPAELEHCFARQSALKTLLRKYADDLEGVLVWRDEAKERLEQIDVSPESLELLEGKIAEAEHFLLKAGQALHKARVEAAQKVGEQVTAEIRGLSMPTATFSIEVTLGEPHSHGLDHVEFMLAPNTAVPARPIAQTASGGELSRVMLAIEVILAASTAGTTLVFDEIDAGVGGKAALAIGQRLAKLAVHHQVIVVTHLPQVAAFADTHLHVAKDDATSQVLTLQGVTRVEEIARMLAGLEESESSQAHATELLQRAQQYRQGLKTNKA